MEVAVEQDVKCVLAAPPEDRLAIGNGCLDEWRIEFVMIGIRSSLASTVMVSRAEKEDKKDVEALITAQSKGPVEILGLVVVRRCRTGWLVSCLHVAAVGPDG